MGLLSGDERFQVLDCRKAKVPNPCMRGTFGLPHNLNPTPSIFPKVLPYKWGAYCSTNGGCIGGFPFVRSLEARKVRRYKWGAYCRTNWRCTAVLFRQVVGVGGFRNIAHNLLSGNGHESAGSSRDVVFFGQNLPQKSPKMIKVARLQSEFCTKVLFLSYEFSYEKCSEVFPIFFEPSFCGSGISH